MFTGIITHLGKVSEITNKSLVIQATRNLLSKISKGTSISINGICLTVIDTNKHSFKIDFMPETKIRTNIKYLQPDDLVNLELPLAPTDFMSGHIVQGHVDTVAKLTNITKQGISRTLKFSIPDKFSKYMVAKGSVAVNGISLTVTETGKDRFTVAIIPYTWTNTILHTIKKNDFVNIEVDILAKYVEKLTERL
ncbi:riboflavin synthase [Patescibacteria group bacterium]|nr:riboflavin synthase [Patescibacteria group bacterium]